MKKRVLTLSIALALMLSSCTGSDDKSVAKQDATPTVATREDGVISRPIEVTSMGQLENYISSEKLTILDLYAVWCGPCKMLEPILEKLASDYAGSVQILKVDGEKNRDIAQRFNLRGFPTLVFIKDGKTLETVVGFRQENALVRLINKHI